MSANNLESIKRTKKSAFVRRAILYSTSQVVLLVTGAFVSIPTWCLVLCGVLARVAMYLESTTSSATENSVNWYHGTLQLILVGVTLSIYATLSFPVVLSSQSVKSFMR
jgi:hypothetical protein